MTAAINATTASGIILIPDNSGLLELQSAGTAGAIISANGIGLGTQVSASGMGIKFPATQVPSSDANTLDDYEEGTYTPAITSGVTSPSYVSGETLGRYVKIGNFVFVDGRVQITSGTTNNDALVISLPFAIAGSSPFFPVGACYFNTVASNGVAARPLAAFGGGAFFVYQRDNASQQNFTGSMFSSVGNVNFTLCYRTT